MGLNLPGHFILLQGSFFTCRSIFLERMFTNLRRHLRTDSFTDSFNTTSLICIIGVNSIVLIDVCVLTYIARRRFTLLSKNFSWGILCNYSLGTMEHPPLLSLCPWIVSFSWVANCFALIKKLLISYFLSMQALVEFIYAAGAGQ